jgi:phage shock protein A
MGFFRSIFRFFGALFGIAEGATQRGTDAMLTANADTIRAQFRKSREDAIQNFNSMKDAVAQLMSIREDKAKQLWVLNKTSQELELKKNGAVEQFKKTQNPALKAAWAKFTEEQKNIEERIDQLEVDIAEQDKQITLYQSKLHELKTQIEKLKTEEAETVAEIVSDRQMEELNSKLSGLSTSTETKNLEAIREARKQIKAKAKLSNQLSGSDVLVAETALIEAGVAAQHGDAFDQLVRLDTVFALLEPTSNKEVRTTDNLHTLLDTIDAEDKKKKETKTVDPVDSLF